MHWIPSKKEFGKCFKDCRDCRISSAKDAERYPVVFFLCLCCKNVLKTLFHVLILFGNAYNTIRAVFGV